MDSGKLTKLLRNAMERHTSWAEDDGLWTLTTDTDIELGPWSVVEGWPTTEGIHNGATFTSTLTCRQFQIARDAKAAEGIEWPARILSTPTTSLELSEDEYKRFTEFMDKDDIGTPADGAFTITFRVSLGISRPTADGELDVYTATLFDLLAFLAAQDARGAGRLEDEAALMEAIPFLNDIEDEPITDAQAAEILTHIGEDRPLMSKTVKPITQTMGADSRRRKFKDEAGNIVTTAGADNDLILYNKNGGAIVADADTGMMFIHLLGVVQDKGLSSGPDEVLRVSTSYADIFEAQAKEDTPGNRRAVRENVRALADLAFRGVSGDDEKGINMCADYGINGRRGTIEFAFTPKFVAHFMGPKAPTMAFDRRCETINTKRHPCAWAIYVLLATHSFLNAEKPNRYRLSVKSLLAHTKAIPTYEDVAETDRAFTRRIVGPMERDLNYLRDEVGILEYWDYCHTKGESLTDEEQDKRLNDKGDETPLAYDIAKDCLIEWSLTRPNDGAAQARMDARRRRALRAK